MHLMESATADGSGTYFLLFQAPSIVISLVSSPQAIL